MKKLIKGFTFRSTTAFVMLSFIQTIAWAQDSTGSVTKSVSRTSTSTTESIWYGEPWVWAVGIAILIIIVIALTRGNGNSGNSNSKQSVTHTEKVTRETDI